MDDNKIPAVPIIVFITGISIPLLFVNFIEGSPEESIYAGSFIPLVLITYLVFRQLGRRYKWLGIWATGSYGGELASLFLGSLIVSSSGVVLALTHFL